MYQQGDMSRLWSMAKQTDLTFNLVTFGLCCMLLVAVAATYVATRSRPVYLLGYHCFKGRADRKVSYEWFMHQSRECGRFDDKALEFQQKVLERSGLGEETYLPLSEWAGQGERSRRGGVVVIFLFALQARHSSVSCGTFKLLDFTQPPHTTGNRRTYSHHTLSYPLPSCLWVATLAVFSPLSERSLSPLSPFLPLQAS